MIIDQIKNLIQELQKYISVDDNILILKRDGQISVIYSQNVNQLKKNTIDSIVNNHLKTIDMDVKIVLQGNDNLKNNTLELPNEQNDQNIIYYDNIRTEDESIIIIEIGSDIAKEDIEFYVSENTLYVTTLKNIYKNNNKPLNLAIDIDKKKEETITLVKAKLKNGFLIITIKYKK